MRTHRPHTKSRNGCIVCKSRKVKVSPMFSVLACVDSKAHLCMQCDEKVPNCTNCEYRSLPCLYPEGTARVREPRSSLKASQEGAPRTSDGLIRSRLGQSSLLELFNQLPAAPPCNGPALADSFLLSEYCQRASVTLAAAGRTDRRLDIFCDLIPSLGFRHQVVSEAMSAVAALFLCLNQVRQHISRNQASHQSSETLSTADFDNLSRPFLHQARIHYAKSLRGLQDEVAFLAQDNSGAVLACSVLLIPYDLASSRIDRYRQQLSEEQSKRCDFAVKQQSLRCRGRHQDECQSLDLSWLHLTLGVTTLLANGKVRCISDDSTMLPLSRLVQDECIVDDDVSKGTAVSAHRLLPRILEDGLAALGKLQLSLQALCSPQATSRSSRVQTSQRVEACLRSLSCLKFVVQKNTASAIPYHSSACFSILAEWVSGTERQFLDLLAKGNGFALAVYAHFLVYMIPLEDFWFVGDLGIATVRKILMVVNGCSLCGKSTYQVSLEQRELFAWPAKISKLYDDVDPCQSC